MAAVLDEFDLDTLPTPCDLPATQIGGGVIAAPRLSEEEDEEIEIPEEKPAIGDFEDFDEEDFDDEFDEDFEGELEDEYELSEFETVTPAELDADEDIDLPIDGDFVDDDEEEVAEPVEEEAAPEEEEESKGKKGKGKKKKPARDDDDE